jgi:hypothetical protein
VFFLLPLLPAFAALTVSLGEAIGIGASAFGIGAAIKGSVDYNHAKTIQEKAHSRYLDMTERIRRKTRSVQNRLEEFAKLKLRTYTEIIHEAVESLLPFKSIDLSSFTDTQVEHISFFTHELDTLKESVIKASNVLSCLSIGVTTAVNDRIPYKDTPPILKDIGLSGMKVNPASDLPAVSHAAIMMAGLSWGISGSTAKTQAENNAVHITHTTKKMEQTLAGFDALLDRITEGENLIKALTEKLRQALSLLPDTSDGHEPAASIETAISLVRALKKIIETDICTDNGLLTAESGVLFRKVQKEYAHV